MDPKNKQQNLTPELKQIYERVMNTTVSPNPKPPTPSAPVTPSQIPTPMMTGPTEATPTPVPPGPDQSAANPAAQAPTAPPPAQQVPSPAQPQNYESVPPRPLTNAGAQPFVFSAKAPTAAQTGNTPQTFASAAKPKKKMSNAVIGALVLVLIVVWSLFWVKFFKLI